MNVAFAERGLFGGTCINTGCMPTKTLIANARAAHVARHAGDWGVVVKGPVNVDFERMMARAHAVSRDAREGIEKMLDGLMRCTVFRGAARFESSRTVRIGDEVVSAPRIFVNVGGRARVPRMPGVDRVPFLTNSSILAITSLPAHLVVIGGSYIGLEFAQMFRRLGSEVTIIEMGPRLIGREDPDISDAVKDIVEREGIHVRLRAECISFEPAKQGVTAGLECESNEKTVTGSHLLLAVGRQPNTDDLGLEKAGVATDAHGYIAVDDMLRTNVEGIWALGECNGHGAFTHTAYNDFEIVAANLLDEAPRKLSDRFDAYALYIDPPLGRVGMTEAQARATERPLLMAKRPMTLVGRAVEKGETQGFMKAVVDAKTKKILGAAILGTDGDEAIHALSYAMYAGATATTIERSVGIHPTVSELLPTLLGSLTPLK